MKFFSFILCIIMLISIVACAAADSNGTESKKSETTNNDSETTTTELKPDLPEKNFNGANFTFINRSSAHGWWEAFDCYAESENGDPINDAVYRRNMIVEDRYNIKITEFKAGGDIRSKLYNSITAGEKLYDAAMVTGSDAAYLAESGYLIDFYTQSYINLDNPWWDQNANSDLSIGGKLFFTCNDIGISDKDASWFMAYNKRILNDNELENPYDIVNDNRWTMDKMYEMAKSASRDLDGDGKMTKNDLWGIAAETYDTYAMLFAGGERIFKNNADGYPEFVLFNERSVNVVDKYMQMTKDKNVYTLEINDSTYHEGHALFMATTLATAREFWRSMDDDFGIIPVPKYDSVQENYYHVVSMAGSGATVSIPITAPDIEMTGIILEDLAYESNKLLRPAYYDICFNSKYLRDSESVGMLQICLNSRTFDFSLIYDWGQWAVYFVGLKADSNVDLASEYAKRYDKTIEAMNKTIDIYKSIK